MTQIFINYRREDSDFHAINLRKLLAAHFGAQQIFMDIDNIEPGEDFVEVINQKVGLCNVLLVLIGKNWVTCKDESEKRRLDNPGDFVRLEIDAALRRKIRVIPVLVGGAKIPNAQEVPTELQPLCRRNAIEISNIRFDQDVERLIETIDNVLANLPVQSANAEDKETVILAVEEKLQTDTTEHQRSNEEAARQLEPERQQETWKLKPLIFSYTLKLTLLITVGWAVAFAVRETVRVTEAFSVRGAVAFAVGGLVTGYALHLTEPSLRWRQIILMAVGGAVGGAVTYAVGEAVYGALGASAVVLAVGGAVGGIVTGYALHLAEPSFRWRQITLVAIGWAVGGAFGGAVSREVGVAVFGAIGGYNTHCGVSTMLVQNHDF